MIFQKTLTLAPYPRGFHLITKQVLNCLEKLPEQGILHVFIQHTSAALTINENCDPTVRHDLVDYFDGVVSESSEYRHDAEGKDDMPAHIKSSLLGSSLLIPITGHCLNLGIWQGIYLCEFRDRSPGRHLVLTVYS